MSELSAKKVYYSIGEACEVVGIKPHVLRYWETQFPDLRPMKNRQGHRIYKAPEIGVVIFIKRLLYHEKRTIDEARRTLAEIQSSPDGARLVDEAVLPGVLATIRSDLDDLRERLPPPERSP